MGHSGGVLRDVEPLEPPSDRRVAVGMGALRGGLAGLAYAVALALLLLASDSGVEGSDVGPALLFFTPFVSMFTVPTGLVAGALLGPACLWAARRLSPRPAAVVCGLVVTILGTSAVPYIPLGDRPDGLGEFLELSLLPGSLGGLAAGWHAWSLSRRVHGWA
jgi:hypothetical protein